MLKSLSVFRVLRDMTSPSWVSSIIEVKTVVLAPVPARPFWNLFGTTTLVERDLGAGRLRCAGGDRFQLVGVAAFVGQLAVLLGVQQHALGRNADPDQAVQFVFKALRAGGGAHAGQAVQALLPA